MVDLCSLGDATSAPPAERKRSTADPSRYEARIQIEAGCLTRGMPSNLPLICAVDTPFRLIRASAPACRLVRI